MHELTRSWHRMPPILSPVLAVGAPFFLLVMTAWRSVPTFDGAMNFQVAENIADGDGFVRDYHYAGTVRDDPYGNTTIAPAEVQTSGFWILIAAAVLKVFGLSTFSLQLTNLLFMFGLLALVWYALRPWSFLQVIGPTTVIFLTPAVAGNSLGGYGEFSIAALAIGALLALARIAEGNRHALKLAMAAFVFVGTAITIKTVAVALLPVVLVGLVLVAYTRNDVPRLPLLATVPVVGIPVVVFEAYRMTQLGSPARWLAYWEHQAGWIGFQSGLTKSGTAASVLDKGRAHLEILSNIVGMSNVVLAVLLVLPGALVVASFLLRGCGVREWLAKPGRLLVTLLVSYQTLYLVWWLFMTPTEKAWLRRVIIGWVVMMVALLVVAGISWTSARIRWPETRFRHARVPAAVATFAVGVVYAGPAAALAAKNYDTYTEPPTTRENDVAAVVQYVEELGVRGDMPCGLHWWGAPVISLYADLPFCNLEQINPCTVPYRGLLESGRVFLVWDRYAQAIIAATPPERAAFTYSRVASPSSYATVYKVEPTDAACPD